MGRKLLAGILGGIAFFAWSAIVHLTTGLAATGMQDIPNEQAVLSSMKANIPGDGFYFFPGYGLPATASQSQRNAVMKERAEKHYVSPSGILIYHSATSFGLKPSQMLTELGTNVVQVLLAVFLLGQANLASFGARWRFITIAGILAAISTNISYWNWYGFPGNYTLAYASILAVGFAWAGLVAAAIVKPGKGMDMARAARA
jgi:hypothetical protein